jgi:hypothetical protein
LLLLVREPVCRKLGRNWRLDLFVLPVIKLVPPAKPALKQWLPCGDKSVHLVVAVLFRVPGNSYAGAPASHEHWHY